MDTETDMAEQDNAQRLLVTLPYNMLGQCRRR